MDVLQTSKNVKFKMYFPNCNRQKDKYVVLYCIYFFLGSFHATFFADKFYVFCKHPKFHENVTKRIIFVLK